MPELSLKRMVKLENRLNNLYWERDELKRHCKLLAELYNGSLEDWEIEEAREILSIYLPLKETDENRQTTNIVRRME